MRCDNTSWWFFVLFSSFAQFFGGDLKSNFKGVEHYRVVGWARRRSFVAKGAPLDDGQIRFGSWTKRLGEEDCWRLGAKILKSNFKGMEH